MTKAAITLVPLLASWHLRTPRYNTEHVAAATLAVQPDVVLCSALPATYESDQSWMEEEQLALPLSVLPRAKQAGVKVVGIREDVQDPTAQTQLRQYLELYDEGKARLNRVDFAFQDVAELLTPALDLPLIGEQLVPLIREWLTAQKEELGSGPGEAWLTERVATMAERVRAHDGDIALVVPVEEVPLWLDHFGDRVALATEAPASEDTKARSLLDVALTGTAEDLDGLYHQLGEMNTPEAEYHRANILFQTGHLTEAAYSLEQTSAGDFFEPYYLPGFLLSRLGQFYDLLGKREQAMKMYRGVRALPYAPAVALDVAIAGLEAPFVIEPPEDAAEDSSGEATAEASTVDE